MFGSVNHLGYIDVGAQLPSQSDVDAMVAEGEAAARAGVAQADAEARAAVAQVESQSQGFVPSGVRTALNVRALRPGNIDFSKVRTTYRNFDPRILQTNIVAGQAAALPYVNLDAPASAPPAPGAPAPAPAPEMGAPAPSKGLSTPAKLGIAAGAVAILFLIMRK